MVCLIFNKLRDYHNLEDLWLISAYIPCITNLHLANPTKYPKLFNHLNDVH